MSVHKGACHCGAVAYEVEIGLEGLIECNCSHCYRKGFVLAFAPRAAFRLTAGEKATTSYFFNQHNVRTLTDVEPWAWTATRVDGRSF